MNWPRLPPEIVAQRKKRRKINDLEVSFGPEKL